MTSTRSFAALLVCSLLTLAGCGAPASDSSKSAPLPAAVDAVRLTNADNDTANWMTYGRTYSEQRFSPLKQIDTQNISQLGLAWSYDLTVRRGQEATPLVVDGVMYVSTAWSRVLALDAVTGARRWAYDPQVPPEWAVNVCCDVVNRGVAVWHGKVFVATLDGRLIALEAATGKPFWETLTIDPKSRYAITGAPRVIKGKVIIGNGGAEFGVRGYVSAYDAETGKLVWRFYTVPGDPSKPFESPILEKAAKTWTGDWWKLGGGATVWDSMAYDPDLDLLFIGAGNGTPWDRRARSPRGGDNLFTCSLIALKPDTGEYVWHYQETPGDVWDFDSAESIVLADLSFGGTPRKVLLHAPKNGFFYVLERATGELISAKPYTSVTWATGVNLTGRPIENSAARYDEAGKGLPVAPGPLGGHSWHSMSFSPQTGLVYIPVTDAGFVFKSDDRFQPKTLAFNTATDFVAAGMPQNPEVKKAIFGTIKGRLSAWDPVHQKEIWRVDRTSPVNGGILSTAGNLVFEGTAQGSFEAYRADTGEKLWSADAQSGIVAAPMTYSVNGEQYVAVLAGWGGVFPLATGEVALKSSGRTQNISRVLVFKLGGKAALPPLPQLPTPELRPPKLTATTATVHKGEALYQRFCSNCHGDVAVSGGVLPDLRYSAALGTNDWSQIVREGLLQPSGMVSFAKELSLDDVEAIRAYVIFRANQSLPRSTTPTH